jgi:RNA polymerase sigma factor (sigma-70 family)
MTPPADKFIPTRESLLRRLKDWDDQTAWRSFFDAYWRLLYSVACKAGLGDADAQDVVQDTMVSVAKQMPGFRYDPAIGSFKSWLMQIARRRISDKFRKKQCQIAGRRFPREERLGTTLMEQHPDPAGVNLEHIWDEEWRKNLFEAAVERVKGRADSLQFQLFQLHVLKQVEARSVAKRLGVNVAEVYYAKYKISAQVRKEIRLLEDKML